VLLALWPIVRHAWLKPLLVAHILIMDVTIIVTAKHWILDVPAGWIALGLAITLETWRLHGFRLRARE
jgi:hypothetical protein